MASGIYYWFTAAKQQSRHLPQEKRSFDSKGRSEIYLFVEAKPAFPIFIS
jgi:hypothetical protein